MGFGGDGLSTLGLSPFVEPSPFPSTYLSLQGFSFGSFPSVFLLLCFWYSTTGEPLVVHKLVQIWSLVATGLTITSPFYCWLSVLIGMANFEIRYRLSCTLLTKVEDGIFPLLLIRKSEASREEQLSLAGKPLWNPRKVFTISKIRDKFSPFQFSDG
ncbi:hypothetical protein SLEP1_g11672 [Rubroshorea leprosula]|nr:hypothetical protein SLEP1_g11672 [Rubroshorea leprosula]